MAESLKTLRMVEKLRALLHFGERANLPENHPTMKTLRRELDAVVQQVGLIMGGLTRRTAPTSARLAEKSISVNMQQSAEDFWAERGVSVESNWPQNRDTYRARALETMGGRQKVQRRDAAVWRATEEARYNIHGPAFLVFDTLTLYETNDFEKRFTRGWQTYRKRVQRNVHAVMGIKRDEKSDIRFLACVEEGERFGRPHMHVLWSLPDIPIEWYPDPNRYERIPRKREIEGMKRLWPHGISAPIALRVSPGDAWATKAGWTWPVGEDGNQLKTSPGTIGGYLGKYLTKPRGEFKWRTRMSHRLGTDRLKATLARCPSSLLRPLCNPMDRTLWLSGNERMPSIVLRTYARRERLLRCFTRYPHLISKWAAYRLSTTLQDSLVHFERLAREESTEFAGGWLWADIAARGGSSERQEAAYQWFEKHMAVPDGTDLQSILTK